MSAPAPPVPEFGHCTRCGTRLLRFSQQGRCPRCLLAAALSVTSPARLPVAQVFPRPFGDYSLLSEIARGGMGVVFRARQQSLGRTVALKVIGTGALATPDLVRRFEAEARAAAALDHPNIVPIFEVGEYEGQHYFTMACIEGQSLAQIVADPARRPSPALAAQWIAQLARAVHHAHQRGVLHRDLKPSNILVDGEGQLHLTDFGLAKLLDGDGSLTRTLAVVGTPTYMSPEQAGGRSQFLTTATDVYGLGAVFYELLTGHPPFSAGTPVAILRLVLDQEPKRPCQWVPGLDRDLEAICLKCLEKDPSRRYGSAVALAEELDRWQRHEPLEVRPSGSFERLTKWGRRHPLEALLVTAIFGGLLAISIISSVLGVRISKARQSLAQEVDQRTQAAKRLHMEVGQHLVNEHDPAAALLPYLEAFRLDAGVAERADVHRRRLGALLQRVPQLERVWFHEGAVNVAHFSPDGRWVVSASDDRTARVWSVDQGQSVIPPLVHPAGVATAGFSPDGRWVATTCADGFARIWDSRTGRQQGPAVPQNERNAKRPTMSGVPFHPRGHRFISNSNQVAQAWDILTGTPVGPAFVAAARINQIRYHPDGSRVLGVSGDGLAWIWDAETGRPISQPWAHDRALQSGEFNPEGNRVLILDDLRSAYLWDVASGRLIGGPVRHSSRDSLVLGAFSPVDPMFLTLGFDSQIQFWNSDTGQTAWPRLERDGNLTTVQFSRSGTQIIANTFAGLAQTLDFRHGDPTGPALHHGGVVQYAEFSPDDRSILTASQDGAVRIWKWNSNPAKYQVAVGPGLRGIAPSSDGRRFLTFGTGQPAELWDAHTGQRQGEAWEIGAGVLSAAFDPRGQQIALGTQGAQVQLRNADTGELLHPPLKVRGQVRFVEFSQSGDRLLTLSASGSDGHAARLWDARTGEALSPPLEHPQLITVAGLSPDGRLLFTGCEDGFIRFFETDHGAPRGQPLSIGYPVGDGQFSPDGTQLVAAAIDGTFDPRSAWIIDVINRKAVLELAGHRDGVRLARYSPDGRWIATGGEDNTVRIWDSRTGHPQGVPLVHRNKVRSLAFSPDSRLLASASRDGTFAVWEVSTGDLIVSDRREDRALNWVGFRPDGREVLTVSADGTIGCWDVSPTTRSMAELEQMAERLTVQRSGASGPETLSPDAWRKLWTGSP
ncbi:MAG: protein kinase [Verrucomicrobia bacterium]|nr:protein kinase [Verrucomicrobiota bacterium]